MVGVITPEGKILYSRKVLWKGEAGNPGRILGNIIQTVDEVLEKHPQCRKNPMGMTIPGLADPEKGVWRSSEFLGVFNLPVGSLFQRRYGVPLKWRTTPTPARMRNAFSEKEECARISFT